MCQFLSWKVSNVLLMQGSWKMHLWNYPYSQNQPYKQFICNKVSMTYNNVMAKYWTSKADQWTAHLTWQRFSFFFLTEQTTTCPALPPLRYSHLYGPQSPIPQVALKEQEVHPAAIHLTTCLPTLQAPGDNYGSKTVHWWLSQPNRSLLLRRVVLVALPSGPF